MNTFYSMSVNRRFLSPCGFYLSIQAIISEDYGNGADNRNVRGGCWRCGTSYALNTCNNYNDFQVLLRISNRFNFKRVPL